MLTLTDQIGRVVPIPTPPLRIISTVPSQTELIFYLGLDAEIIGVTKFCTHPLSKVNSKPVIGGTKHLDIPLIRLLKPNLIIANKEENERNQLEELMDEFPIYVSNPADLTSALQMITDIGALTNLHRQAEDLTHAIRTEFEQLRTLTSERLKVAYLIWRKPYMVAGIDTFINNMLVKCGFENVFEKERYPQISAAMLKSVQPDVLLLSSEPYPFKPRHIKEFEELLPDAIIKLVDGELFSWYGSRLLQSPKYFNTLIRDIKKALSLK